MRWPWSRETSELEDHRDEVMARLEAEVERTKAEIERFWNVDDENEDRGK